MPTLQIAEGPLLTRLADAMPPSARDGLSAAAFATWERAVQKTAWAQAHRRRLVLMDGDVMLATAVHGRLAARFDGQPMRVCAIGSPWAAPGQDAGASAAALIDRLLAVGRADGADLVLLTASNGIASTALEGFEPLPTADVEVRVIESTRHGAPMTMVRGGEDRDLPAIVAMAAVRAGGSRFHLVRDVDFVKYALTRRRLLAGLSTAGQRELRFLIAEEGITAAAYVVLTATAGTWTIEECGDRDPSGARIGALLQATVAREPVERRPVIRGWLPASVAPPQLTIGPSAAPPVAAFVRRLSPPSTDLALAAGQVLYWRNDVL